MQNTYENWRDGLLDAQTEPDDPYLDPKTVALRAIAAAEPMNGLDRAVRMALECNSAAIRRAVLERARSGDPTVRVNMAALLYYLCGKTDSEFDWDLRPYFLRFGEEGRELNLVWNELQALLNDFERGGLPC